MAWRNNNRFWSSEITFVNKENRVNENILHENLMDLSVAINEENFTKENIESFGIHDKTLFR